MGIANLISLEIRVSYCSSSLYFAVDFRVWVLLLICEGEFTVLFLSIFLVGLERLVNGISMEIKVTFYRRFMSI